MGIPDNSELAVVNNCINIRNIYLVVKEQYLIMVLSVLPDISILSASQT